MSNVELEWDIFAEESLKMAPIFVRSKIKKRVEEAALEQGIAVITCEFMNELQKNERGDVN
ncbi:protochlorophyllide oxidoreductase [Aestuariicella hydrocarbonica]|uniref:Protochlorophyllide oxidoreductase n=1 Tax=Pseudomaricurvus hydrocarbonicus TaxID=1470433 RepID=A0A9E5MN20_9GAMM|nr:PCP reductase family protein [Aestuariicella hydrocarbonica]NHO67271.1 protochlorophyllide oxidoreductase [Aestuariicella hydrocarbonica]